MIESYHNQIKTIYFGRSRNLRVDRLLYLLAKVITIDYRQDNVKTLLWLQNPRLAAEEETKKRKANTIDANIARSMVVKISETVRQLK